MLLTIPGVLDEVTGKNSTDRALNAQHRGAQGALNIQRDMYGRQIEQGTPWTLAGTQALSQMQDPRFQQNFTMADFQADPGYQFRMNEGLRAIQNSAPTLNSGRTLKALTGYGQGLASQEYQNAYNRFNADNDRNFNRLGSLAGLGHSTNSQLMNASQNYGNQASNIHMGYGNAQGAAHINQYNNMANLMGQGAGAAMMAFSDERLKTDVRPISKDELDELRKNLRAYRFKYIDKKYGDGEWIGVMAQDLEKSSLGKTLVSEDANGNKFLNTNKILSLFLATMAEGA